jgi:DNA uptake protein ComE-like DNA-binding protein
LRSSLLPRILLTASLILPISVHSAVKVGEPGELRDLHYGEVLFQLYQQNYFEAIVHLLSARKQGLMKAYEDEPELLLGGLYLAYGMPDPAETLFQRVLEKSASPELQSRAWLQLAKARHRRDDSQAAEKALNKVGKGLKPAENDESVNLLGLIQLQRNEDRAALDTLNKLKDESDWSLYADFNQAIAHLRQGEQKQALDLLHKVGDTEAASEEMKAVKDRANLLLGYLMLEAKQPDAALQALQKVRLHGPSSSQALLGAGWASLQQNKPDQALVPWQMLAARTTNEPAVLEVQLAIPYALAQLQAEQQSLQGYNDAIARFSASIGDIDRAMQTIQQSGFPDNLLNDTQQADDKNPDESALQAQLPLLLSKNAFQERLQDYRDLRQLERNLQGWQEKIVTYQGMLDVRMQAYAQQNPKVDAFLAGDSLKQMEGERDKLQSTYEKAASPEEPPFTLTTSEEKAALKRLDHINELIEKYNQDGRLDAQREAARLMQGILVWRTVTEQPARIWTLKKQMTDLDQNLDKTRKLMADLGQARQQTKGRFAAFGQRIDKLEQGIPVLLKQTAALRSEEAKKLQDMAIAVLEQRKTLLHDYLIQARFGVASLLDSSSAANQEGSNK